MTHIVRLTRNYIAVNICPAPKCGVCGVQVKPSDRVYIPKVGVNSDSDIICECCYGRGGYVRVH